MKRILKNAGVVLSLLVLGGCVSLYRFESEGLVLSMDGTERPALLYWYGDDGRLWYGRRYRQIETGASLIICGTTPKELSPALHDGEQLRISSRAGDRLVAELRGGEVVPLEIPVVLREGGSCGHVLVDRRAVLTDALEEGTTPTVAILCDNPGRPSRYPRSRAYVLSEVKRIKVDSREVPTPCEGG